MGWIIGRDDSWRRTVNMAFDDATTAHERAAKYKRMYERVEAENELLKKRVHAQRGTLRGLQQAILRLKSERGDKSLDTDVV